MENQTTNTNNESQPMEKEAVLPKVGFELSKVASNPKQSLIIIVVGVLLAVYVLYGALKEDSSAKKDNIETVAKPKIILKPSQNVDSSQSAISQVAPKAPDLKDPTAPSQVSAKKDEQIADEIKAPVLPQLPSQPIAPNVPKETNIPIAPNVPKEINIPKDLVKANSPPPPPPPSSIQPMSIASTPSDAGLGGKKAALTVIPNVAVDADTKKRIDAKRKSSIVLVGGASQKSQEQIDQDASFKLRSDLEYTLGRGKIIDAITETAINTDFPAEIRAVISRDVYSESGRTILIPKGTKVFGTFAGNADTTYGRVNINWVRVDLPTGYVLNLQGTAVDDLGRGGVQGRLDTKVKEQISASVLSTALSVGFASAVDKLVPPQQTGNQAAASQAQAGGLQTAVQGVYNNTTLPSASKIGAMCNAAYAAITDPTSTTYKQIQTACSTIPSTPGSTPDQTSQALYNALMAASNTTIANSVQASTPTKAQQATQQGMDDFSKTVKNVLTQSVPKPTVTIDQGTEIKIYVAKDYKFPKAAVNKSKVLR